MKMMKYLLLLLLALALPVMGEELTDEEWTARAQAALDRVVAVYPEAADPGTYFGRRMNAIDAEWEEAGDPRFDDPEKAILIARIILEEIRVAEVRRQARAEKRRSVAVQSPAPAARPSGTIVSPDGVKNFWTNKDGSVQIVGPDGVTTIYRD